MKYDFSDSFFHRNNILKMLLNSKPDYNRQTCLLIWRAEAAQSFIYTKLLQTEVKFIKTFTLIKISLMFYISF